MAYPDVVAAMLAGRTVVCARLVELELADGTARHWIGGTGPLATTDGRVWSGVGAVSTIEAIEQQGGLSAPSVTLTLSGVDGFFLTEIVNSEHTVKNRAARVYRQFYDENFAPLDTPIADFIGRMDVMTFKQTANSPPVFTIELTLEWLLTGLSKPRFSYLTDADQKERFPGDNGCSQVAAMKLISPNWPLF